MKIIIIGAGRVGRTLIRELKEDNHDIAVMDYDEDICKEISNEYDVLVFKGDVTSIDDLENINPKEYDVLICVTGDDEKNILGCLLAKEMGVEKVIARVSDPRLSRIAHKLGISEIVCPEEAVAEKISKLIRGYSGKIEERIPYIGIRRIQIKVGKDSPVIGKKIEDLPLKESWMIIRIRDKDGRYIPFSPSITIQSDYILDMIVREGCLDAVKSLFT